MHDRYKFTAGGREPRQYHSSFVVYNSPLYESSLLRKTLRLLLLVSTSVYLWPEVPARLDHRTLQRCPASHRSLSLNFAHGKPRGGRWAEQKCLCSLALPLHTLSQNHLPYICHVSLPLSLKIRKGVNREVLFPNTLNLIVGSHKFWSLGLWGN
jgi:hypothetical protein